MAITVGDALLRMGVKKDQFERDIDGAQKLVKDRMAKMQQALKMAGVAFTAMGAAGLKLVADSRKINAALEATGVTLGLTTEEMRDMALEATNVTFSLDAVTGTFELLARAGLRGREEMVASATAIDTLGDAVGVTADEMAATLIPVWKAFGVELPKTAGDLDHFTWLAKNTTVNLSDFGSVLAYLAPEMDNLSLSMDDAIVMLAAMEGKGLTGSAATRVFRTAVTEAVNENKDLSETLGLTNEEMDRYRAQMEDTTGITQQYADAANRQYGLMDKLKQTWSELTLRVGSLLQPLEPLLGIMTALGPAMIFFGSAMGAATLKMIAHTTATIAYKVAAIAVTVATKAWTVAQWLLNVALAASPIGAIALAVTALVAGITALVVFIKKWTSEEEKATAAGEELKSVTLDQVIAFDKLADGFDAVAIAAKEELEYTLDASKRKLQDVIDTNAKLRALREEHEESWTEWLDTEEGKRQANRQHWYDIRLAARKALFADMERIEEQATETFAERFERRNQAEIQAVQDRIDAGGRALDARIDQLNAETEADAAFLAIRQANYERFTAWRIAKDRQQEAAALQLKKAQVGLAAEERKRLMQLIGSRQITRARAPTTREVAWRALAGGEGPLRGIGGAARDISGWPTGALPLLPGLRSTPTAGAMQPRGGPTVVYSPNIAVQIDGETLARILGEHMVDQIQIAQGIA